MSNELQTKTMEMVRVEIDSSVATAKQYPRDVKQCRKDLVEYCTMDEETAKECVYALPRGNKEITGPSVRMAELAVMSWGNVRAGYRITEITDKYVTAEGVAKDIEKNTEAMAQAKVRIVDRNGKRYNDDMIQVAQMAAGAKAYRNAVFKIIPAAFINEAIRAVNKVVEQSASVNLEESIPKTFKLFSQYGVTREDILSFFKLDNDKQLQGSHIVKLRAYYQALVEGTDPSSIFKTKAQPQFTLSDDLPGQTHLTDQLEEEDHEA